MESAELVSVKIDFADFESAEIESQKKSPLDSNPPNLIPLRSNPPRSSSIVLRSRLLHWSPLNSRSPALALPTRRH